MSRLVVVSNRVQIPRGDRPQAGGMAVAIIGALKREGGLWFGWDGTVTHAPTNRPRHHHRDGVGYATLPLGREDYDDYYLGYSNEVVWPVFHFNLGAMGFQRRFERAYQRVNALFADALVPLLQGDEHIWVHDYHLIPLARELRQRGVASPIGFFLHIPFPCYDLLRAMPGHRDLLADLLHYDLLGTQTANDLHALRAAMSRSLNASQRERGLRWQGRDIDAGVFPVGVDVGELEDLASRSAASPRVQRLVQGLGGRNLIVGVDRLDYSKGLPERLRAYEALLCEYPDHRQRTVYMQIASPSRTSIQEYDDLRRQLDEATGHINGTYADLDWVPMHYLNKTFARGSLMGLHRAARVGLVTPLRDGMNLVAKEFVAAQDPRDPGALVLSDLAGAARELGAALLVNPYDSDAIAVALHRALTMPLEERRERHQAMMQVLRRNDLTRWSRSFIERLQGCHAG